jgi:L-histidine N-alpha-methyltransferase
VLRALAERQKAVPARRLYDLTGSKLFEDVTRLPEYYPTRTETTLGAESWLLIGVDRLKDIDRLIVAYDDAEGVTGAFNLNLLHRINRELGGDIPIGTSATPPAGTRTGGGSRCTWKRSRISTSPYRGARSPCAGARPSIPRTATNIRLDQVRLMLQAGGWAPARLWSDPSEDFLLVLAEATEQRSAP